MEGVPEWRLHPPGIQFLCLSLHAGGSGRRAVAPAEPPQAEAVEFVFQHRGTGLRGQRQHVSRPNLRSSRAH